MSTWLKIAGKIISGLNLHFRSLIRHEKRAEVDYNFFLFLLALGLFLGGNFFPLAYLGQRNLSLRAHTGLPVIGGAGAYSSQKGRAPWRGQCHQPRVGVPPLRPAGLTSWAVPYTKKISWPNADGFLIFQCPLCSKLSEKRITGLSLYFKSLVKHENRAQSRSRFSSFPSCSFLDSFSRVLETLLSHLLQLLGSKRRLREPL